MGIVARNDGRLAEAQEHLEQAAKVLAKGSVRSHALATNALADVHRELGDSARAEALYAEAAAVLRSLGSIHAVFPEVNRGLLLIHAGDVEGARAALKPAHRTLEAHDMGAMLGATELALAACAAQSRQWEELDAHLEKSRTLLHESGYVDPDIARVAELAAASAERFGQYDRAWDALKVAEAQWATLGRDTELAAVRAIFLRLREPS
jgi:ATP/maltotriose-dependent transcriptional regulator MalT